MRYFGKDTFLFVFLLAPFFCMSRYLCHMYLSQMTGELCPVYKGHALAGPSTPAPGLTSSFFAHVKNLWFRKKKKATLVSRYATLKQSPSGEIRGRMFYLSTRFYFLYTCFDSTTGPNMSCTSLLKSTTLRRSQCWPFYK